VFEILDDKNSLIVQGLNLSSKETSIKPIGVCKISFACKV